jgi:hypothetical protein
MDQRESRETCLCGCGQPVAAGREWKRGHAARGRDGFTGAAPAVPPPHAPAWDAGADIIDIDGPSRASRDDAASPAGSPTTPAGDLPPAAPDEPPLHATREWRDRRAAGKTRAAARPPRITAAVRGDIDAKISFALEIPGRLWQARDPVCGSVFVEQRPEISAALTDIICQSADLVAWFTGPGGNFMMVLNLMAACWPVVTMAMAHHVYHSIEDTPQGDGQGEGAGPDYSRYAA